MRSASLEFLKAMLHAPSPSGYEGPVRQVYLAETGRCADSVTTDVHGNAIAALNPDGRPRVMLAGHMDELGFQVAYVGDDGFLSFGTVGGFDLAIVPGRKVVIHTARGPVSGVTGKKPVHAMSPDDRKKVPEQHELWIDIGAADGKEAARLVAIGDPVTYEPNFEILRGDVATSRGFDDKMGAFIAAEVMRRVAESKRKLRAGLYSVATVQEEVGLRGARTSAYGIDPQVGIALDVTVATDHPSMDKRRDGDLRVGKGPVIARGANVNPVVFDRLVATAKRKKIPYQVSAEPGGTGTDANAIQLSRAGVATGLVSVALRYMHTPVEILSLRDLDWAADLLAEFVLGLDPKVSFIP
ncbi:MAG: M42 family metallopeptidase [Gemmatimonadota bacterium]